MIIKGVGQKTGWVNKQLVSNGMDIIKTVLDYGDIVPPDYMRGRSLKDAVENRTMYKLHDAIVIECENGIGAVNDRYKYVLYDQGARNEQFYDLTVNSGEMYNQISEACYQEEVEKLQRVIAYHVQNRPSLGYEQFLSL